MLYPSFREALCASLAPKALCGLALMLFPLVAVGPAALAQGDPKANTITIDATHQQKISPYIYGANFPDWEKINANYPGTKLAISDLKVQRK